MKKNVNKVSSDFEKLLNDEFQNKWETKPKSQEVAETQENSQIKKDEKEGVVTNAEAKHDDVNKKDTKPEMLKDDKN